MAAKGTVPGIQPVRSGPGTTRPEPEDVYARLAPAYEILASDGRIRAEVDALEPQLRALGVRALLDAGCAVGLHSIELARRGFSVVGIDRSAAMIREAHRRSRGLGLPARFLVADLADATHAPGTPFDAILCLGNTASSLRTDRERVAVLRAFHAALRPGGLLVMQMRDLSTIRKTGHLFPLRAIRKQKEEWILMRRQDPRDGKIEFRSTLLYRRSPSSEWELVENASIVPVVPPKDWIEWMRQAGFVRTRAALDLRGTPRLRSGGPDLVLFGRAGL